MKNRIDAHWMILATSLLFFALYSILTAEKTYTYHNRENHHSEYVQLDDEDKEKAIKHTTNNYLFGIVAGFIPLCHT
jgi:hypothetical protein